MPPRETLAKYGLSTDVKSVKERIQHDLYWDMACKRFVFNGYDDVKDSETDIINRHMAHLFADETRKADLDLLCELAEKCEKIQEFCDERFHPIDAMYQIKRILDGEK